uniref:Lipoprotein n=1 Tax=Panagrellus redivivus TaxID=6233 RepID=A0A7E4ZQU7_PANRE
MLKNVAKVAAIVVIGGCTEPAEVGCLSSIELLRLDGAKRKFELVENVLSEPRRGPAIGMFGKDVVIAGGCASPGRHLKSVEVLKLGADKIYSIPGGLELAEEGSCAAFCQYQDSVFIAGGFNGPDCLYSTCLLSPTTVTSLPRLPTRLKNAAAVTNPSNPAEILLFGGWDESRTLNTVFSLNPTQESSNCSMTGLLPYKVEGHTATPIGDKILLIGGYDGVTPTSTISIYDPETASTEILDVKLDIARENHATVYLENSKELFVIGGWDGQSALSNVEVFNVTENPIRLQKAQTLELVKARQKAPAVVVDF